MNKRIQQLTKVGWTSQLVADHRRSFNAGYRCKTLAFYVERASYIGELVNDAVCWGYTCRRRQWSDIYDHNSQVFRG